MRAFPLSALFVALTSAVALAWDPAGHMLIGQIAWENMTPAARAKATTLVATLDNTYNEREPYNVVTAGCWMDDMREQKGYAYAKWHYVNIPWTKDASGFALPEPPHVVWAIGENLRTLRDRAAAPAQAAEALGMLIHFLGDLHMPLHATDRDDRGGNAILVDGVPFSDLRKSWTPNLHAYWDRAFRFDVRDGQAFELWKCPPPFGRPKAAGEGVIAEEATKITHEFPRVALAAKLGKYDAVANARESYTLACLAAYPPDYTPSDVHATTLPPDFVKRSRPLASERIALAGYRLAEVLNELFTDPPPK